MQLLDLLLANGDTDPTILGFGGSRGGAKSAGIQRCALSLATKQSGIGITIFRRLYAELRENHIDKMLDTWPWLRDNWHATDREIQLKNGSKIKFRCAETAEDLKKKQRGMESKYLFVDQAEELSEEELLRLKTSCRWPDAGGPGECKLILAFNPGGPGNAYLRRVFYLRQYQAHEHPQDYAFIQAYGWDNYQWFTHLCTEEEFEEMSGDPPSPVNPEGGERYQLYINHTDYGRKMNALPESLRMGELLGRFDKFAGQYFSEVWDEAKCVLGASTVRRLIQPWWTKWGATDWGYSHFAYHVNFASGKLKPADFARYFGGDTEYPIDVVIAYSELLVNRTAEEDLASQIVDLAGEDHIQQEFLSPDAFAKKGSARTVAEQMGDVFERRGYPLPDLADNDRVGGWRLVFNGFKHTCAMRGQSVTDEMAGAGPMLLVSADCPNLISSMPIAMCDEDNPLDILKTPTWEDDVLDGFRYGYKSFISPRKKAPEAVRAQEAWAAAAPNPMSQAMAMLRFADDAKKERGRVRLSRVRIR